MSVAIMEADEVGGTCALRGCNPKKVLVHAAELIDSVQRSQGHLIAADSVRVPWRELVSFEQQFVEPISKSATAKFTSKGICIVRGKARFTGPTTVECGEDSIEAKYVVVATGAVPAPLDFPGAEHVATSDDFLTMSELPSRVVFLGGGYISFKFAHIAVRAGAQVTILHRGARPLKEFESSLVDRLVEASRSAGIEVKLDTEVTEVRRETDGGLCVTARRGGQECSTGADLVVHGGGRVPDLDQLNLEAGGIEREKEGISVTDSLRSVSNRHVLAAGDCAASGQPKLTPVADVQGHAIAQALLEDRDVRPVYGPVPRVVFTVPPLASIGLTESQATSKGVEFEVHEADTTGWSTNRKVNAAVAGYKVLTEKRSDRILGAHLLGPSADETVNLFALAMRFGIKADELKSVLFAYPTFSAEIRRMV